MSSELSTDELASGAIISPCGHYRYHLWRIWEPTLPVCVWVMLNPSTADEHTDDPTIRKCIAIARHNGFGGISVRNVFAYRATDKTDLLKVNDPVGADNSGHLLAARSVSILTRLVLGWGKPFGGSKLARHFKNAEMILKPLSPYCIKQNKDGSPIHPLYQKNESKMVKFV